MEGMLFRVLLKRFFLVGAFAALFGALPLGPAPASLRAFLGQLPPSEKQNTSEENEEGSDVEGIARVLRHSFDQHPPRGPDERAHFRTIDTRETAISVVLYRRTSHELPRRTAPPDPDDDDPDEQRLS